MNILTLSLMLIGIVFIIMGYMNMFYNIKKVDSLTEYRTTPFEVNKSNKLVPFNSRLNTSLVEIKDENGNDVSISSF